jgi:hemerythrin
MVEKRLDHNFFEMVKEEHQELVGVMGKIRHSLTVEERDPEGLDALIIQLCDLVESHFKNEEAGGYLREAIDQAPRLSERAEQLHDQHRTLWEELQGLRTLVEHREAEASDQWWDQLRGAVEAFARNLLTHEAREDDLVQEAFTQDIGAKD